MSETSADQKTSSSGELLFCPFCRECYDDRTECPEHELGLVRFEQLKHTRELDDHEPLSALDPRFGRGLALLGALSLVVGFFSPFVEISTPEASRAFTAFEAAGARSPSVPSLWAIPVVALIVLWILVRRRTPATLRGARLVALLVGISPAASIGYAIFRVQQGVAQWNAGGVITELSFGWGAGLIGAASLILVVAAARLGVHSSGSRADGG